MAKAGKLQTDELIRFMDNQGKIDDDATLIVLGVESDPNQELETSLRQDDYDLPSLRTLAGQQAEPSDVASIQWSNSEEGPRGIPTIF